MPKKLSRSDALENISTWSTNDVFCLLRKNGLESCCKAAAKRQVDGDELLHLTEGKLALWKSDLTRPLIWSLWKFVEEVKRNPEKYVEAKASESHRNEDHLSDTGSWGTDFEDEINEDHIDSGEPRRIMRSNSQYITSCGNLRINSINEKEEKETVKIVEKEEETDETYANCAQEDGGTYANFQDTKNLPQKNPSRLHGQIEKSLAAQLKEELQLRNVKKPMIRPKPESLPSKKTETELQLRTQPQKSFLHNISKAKPNAPSQTQKRMSVPPPPEPKKKKDTAIEKLSKESLKQPATIRNLDLVANLPTRTEESEDEYEPFDEQIIEQNQKKDISRGSSKQSLASGNRSSVESVYQPPSITSHEDEEEPYEIYESITETPDDDGYYLSPIQRTPIAETPPPLPSKPVQSPITASPNLNIARQDSPEERSPEKKSATLPHSSSNSSLSSERATRPLPPPPDRQSYTDKPWFHNVTREQAAALIRDQSTYGNPQDGYFLLRPSTTKINHPLALVLWYRDRVYNVPVRKRPDNRYALGTAKANEWSFSSVEEIVMFYSREQLVLHTGGSTRLTDTPRK